MSFSRDDTRQVVAVFSRGSQDERCGIEKPPDHKNREPEPFSIPVGEPGSIELEARIDRTKSLLVNVG